MQIHAEELNYFVHAAERGGIRFDSKYRKQLMNSNLPLEVSNRTRNIDIRIKIYTMSSINAQLMNWQRV